MPLLNGIAENEVMNVSRRSFLKGAGGLTLGVCLPVALSKFALAESPRFAPNAFVRIGPDNTVTVIAKFIEMGQGSYTGVATLVAEELCADWSQVRVEGAPADAKLYTNSAMGVQGTGGSSAMAGSYEQMRQAGASAKAMLVAAAAARWNVAPASITVSKGVVSHAASGRKATFGELAEVAAKQPVPTTVSLKDPKDFELIGKQKLQRKDSVDKSNGTAIFTQDFKLPGMLVAVVAHPTRFGARVQSFDATKAKAIPGVVTLSSLTPSTRTTSAAWRSSPRTPGLLVRVATRSASSGTRAKHSSSAPTSSSPSTRKPQPSPEISLIKPATRQPHLPAQPK